MSQNPNQFQQSVTKGQVDARFSPTVLPCEASEDGLKPGMALTIVDSAGGVPKVAAAVADTDLIFGFVSYNIKNAVFNTGDPLEVAMEGTILYLEAGAAIARGAKVMPVVTGEKVITAIATKPICGVAIDKATEDTQLIRVYVRSFGSESVPAS